MGEDVYTGTLLKLEKKATPANPVKKGDKVKWSYVYFGSYPQTQVLKKDVTKAMRRAKYDKNGDATVNGVKYRRVSRDKYEELSWDDMDSIFNDELGLSYWGDEKYLYFKWEPIKWRVLKNDGNTLFVITDRIIADQWNENGSTTWEDSTIREFLNDTFYNQAFNRHERDAIVAQTVKNQKYDLGNDTIDKVYLPDVSDVKGKSKRTEPGNRQRLKSELNNVKMFTKCGSLNKWPC